MLLKVPTTDAHGRVNQILQSYGYPGENPRPGSTAGLNVTN